MSSIITHGPLPSPLPPSRATVALQGFVEGCERRLGVFDGPPEGSTTLLSTAARLLTDVADRVLTFLVRVMLSVVIETEPPMRGASTRARHYW